jgi:hypothetical protein
VVPIMVAGSRYLPVELLEMVGPALIPTSIQCNSDQYLLKIVKHSDYDTQKTLRLVNTTLHEYATKAVFEHANVPRQLHLIHRAKLLDEGSNCPHLSTCVRHISWKMDHNLSWFQPWNTEGVFIWQHSDPDGSSNARQNEVVSWPRTRDDGYLANALAAFPKLTQLSIQLKWCRSRLDLRKFVSSLLVLTPLCERLVVVEISRLRWQDIHVTPEQQRSVTETVPVRNTIRELKLTFHPESRKPSKLKASLLPWMVGQMRMLQRLELHSVLYTSAGDDFPWPAMQLMELKHLTITNSLFPTDALQNLIFANGGNLETIWLENTVLVPGLWRVIFDRLRTSHPRILDISRISRLTRCKEIERWVKDDFLSWNLLCECIALRRERQGLPAKSPLRTGPISWEVL